MFKDRDTPLWVSIPLVLVFLGLLGWAIVRYTQHEDPPADTPSTEEKGKGKGKGLPGPPPMPRKP